jgi:hypothetical protein
MHHYDVISFQRVGCDWEVDSDAKEDRCGICHGDGSQCETRKGLYSKRDGSGDYKSQLCALCFILKNFMRSRV